MATDAKRECEHLARANRHIAQAHQFIAEQKKLIAKLECDGADDIEMAVSMPRAFKHALHAFERHRELIMKLLQDGK